MMPNAMNKKETQNTIVQLQTLYRLADDDWTTGVRSPVEAKDFS
jgi:hypothetical protein